jgi:hypothetical protein
MKFAFVAALLVVGGSMEHGMVLAQARDAQRVDATERALVIDAVLAKLQDSCVAADAIGKLTATIKVARRQARMMIKTFDLRAAVCGPEAALPYCAGQSVSHSSWQ